MPSKFQKHKIERKQRRCLTSIQRECKIDACPVGNSVYLAILNAGLSTGLTEEAVLLAIQNYGELKRLIMLPGASYCFLICASIADAQCIYENLHGKAPLAQNDNIIYMSFVQAVPDIKYDIGWQEQSFLPKGLMVLKDFITVDEEQLLLTAIDLESDIDAALKHRQVKHFGYEFDYGINNVDIRKPLPRQIPKEFEFLWQKLQANEEVKANCTLEWSEPDQLTVNAYAPGQGIPPHIDTPSAFMDPILSLSLLGDVVMEFRRDLDKIPVFLPRRSLLLMSQEARYEWSHGITPRLLDIVVTAKGNLTTTKRSKRISLTFRKLKSDPTAATASNSLNQIQIPQIQNDLAQQLEELNVHNVYDRIAEHFHETRHTPWPRVTEFLNTFPASSILLDVGCGNGKYLNCNPHLLNIGCDRSCGLLNVCSTLRYNVFRCDCLHIPIRSNSIDGCISIAVIHHLASKERRLAAVRELARILRPNGRCLIYVWAKNQCADNKTSSYLRQNKSVQKNKLTVERQRQKTVDTIGEQAAKAIVSLPIHTNRTEFLQQDIFVPWKVKSTSTSAALADEQTENQTFLRYYHVFEKQELESLVEEIAEVKLLSSYYDQGNHCLVFEKI